jgi:hypothetical protein
MSIAPALLDVLFIDLIFTVQFFGRSPPNLGLSLRSLRLCGE